MAEDEDKRPMINQLIDPLSDLNLKIMSASFGAGGVFLTGMARHVVLNSGYKIALNPATMASSYSRDDIYNHVYNNTRFAFGDNIIKSDPENVERIYNLYAENLQRVPAWQQVLVIDGNKPVIFGKSLPLRLNSQFGGVFNPITNDVRVRHFSLENPDSFDDPLNDLHFQDTFNHEKGHEFDWNARSKNYSFWSDNQKWKEAVDKELIYLKNHEIELKRENYFSGNYDPDFIPEESITGNLKSHLDSYPPVQHAAEAIAELTAISNKVYVETKSWQATNDLMQEKYPHTWPIYRDEFIPEMQKIAQTVNPHIDVSLPHIEIKAVELSLTAKFPQPEELPLTAELPKSLNRANAGFGAVDAVTKAAHGDYIGSATGAVQSGFGVAGEFMAEGALRIGVAATVTATVGKGIATYNKTGSLVEAGKASDKELLVVGSTTLGIAAAPTLLGTGYTSAAIALGAESGAAAITGTALTGVAGAVIATGGTVLVAGAAVYAAHKLGEKDAETLNANAEAMAELREQNSAHFNMAVPRDDIRHYEQLNQLLMQNRGRGADKTAALDPDVLKKFIEKRESELAKAEQQKSWAEKAGDTWNKTLGDDMLIDSERDKVQLEAAEQELKIYARAFQQRSAGSVSMTNISHNNTTPEKQR